MNENTSIQARKAQALSLLKEHRLDEARDIYAELCRIDPQDAESWFRLGTTNLERCAWEHAEICFHHVINLRPQLVIAYYNLGRALELQEKGDEAIAVYRKLLDIGHHSEAYCNIATIYAHQAKFTEALEAYLQAQSMDPDNPRLIAGEAGIYEKQGDYDKAYARIQPLLALGRGTPEVAVLLASLSQYVDCRAQAIGLLEDLVSRPELAGNRDVLLPMHLSLGNLLDAAGEYDRAFRHFRLGNDMTRTSFDMRIHAAFIDSIMQVFTKDFMRAAPRSRDPGDHLIFILGMPRSGTSLIEQILDSHPQVTGCGELKEIGDIASNLNDAQGAKKAYPDGVVFLTAEKCDQLAQSYVQYVKTLSGGADYVTDKMPQNFMLLGLIAMLFPGAKIIHSVRDALDTCLSCYFQYFQFQHKSLGFSIDLSSLGAYYRQYQRLMAHWRTVLDMDILDVQYEMLVADQEKMTRQLLEFCGLPWNDQCLKFYDTGRAVTTASYNQVRKPMYRKSLQRWKNYENHLEPLKRALFE